jgi:hypothetical protein
MGEMGAGYGSPMGVFIWRMVKRCGVTSRVRCWMQTGDPFAGANEVLEPASRHVRCAAAKRTNALFMSAFENGDGISKSNSKPEGFFIWIVFAICSEGHRVTGNQIIK